MHERVNAPASWGPVVPTARDGGLLRRGTPAHQGLTKAVSQPGRPLERDLQTEFGSRFGRDFGDVRVHTDAAAAASAAELGASAYTAGRSIVFGAGQYSPEPGAGRQLLAHELAHVTQQGAGDIPTAGNLRVDPSASAEAAADRAAVNGPPARPQATGAVSGGVVQRQTTDDSKKKAESKPATAPPAATAATASPPVATSPPVAVPPGAGADPAAEPRKVLHIDWSKMPLWGAGREGSPVPPSPGPLEAGPRLPLDGRQSQQQPGGDGGGFRPWTPPPGFWHPPPRPEPENPLTAALPEKLRKLIPKPPTDALEGRPGPLPDFDKLPREQKFAAPIPGVHPGG